MRYRLTMEGLDQAELDTGHFAEFEVPSERSMKIHAKVRLDPKQVTRSRQEFTFILTPLDAKENQDVRQSSMFYTPSENLKQ